MRTKSIANGSYLMKSNLCKAEAGLSFSRFLSVSVLLLVQIAHTEQLRDHEAVLDSQGRLLPWTSYDYVIKASMNFIKHCPTVQTKLGEDPWYLVTADFKADGTFNKKQNNQGSNVFWAVETLIKYYAYCGDREAFVPVRRLLDRVLMFTTPADWEWANVPRTQDDDIDGEYLDSRSEPDKMCMVGIGYLKFYKLTGEKKYLDAALKIAATVAAHVRPGDATHSPLPFRVDLQSGKVLDEYDTNIIYVVYFFDELAKLGYSGDNGSYRTKRDLAWQWIMNYPMKNNKWSGYYEDVVSNHENLNQQNPMETARYILQYPALDPDYKLHVPSLIGWVENRFGKTKRFGATSIREQDSCFLEMSSHTARYASIVARWYAVTQETGDREEARAAFALATYSAYNKHSKNDMAINYVGLGYTNPWFSDSYFDYLYHIFEGMAELPEMALENENHIISTQSVITKVGYSPRRIEYQAFEPDGSEILKVTFKPKVFAGGKPLPRAQWQYGDYRGVPGILRIQRKGVTQIIVQEE